MKINWSKCKFNIAFFVMLPIVVIALLVNIWVMSRDTVPKPRIILNPSLVYQNGEIKPLPFDGTFSGVGVVSVIDGDWIKLNILRKDQYAKKGEK